MVSAQITTHTTGFKTTREGISTSKKITNLKPIDHTNHKKFKPHPKLYEKFRTKIPAKRQLRLASEQPSGSRQDEIVSPYQMMLDEMKNNEKDAEDAMNALQGKEIAGRAISIGKFNFITTISP